MSWSAGSSCVSKNAAADRAGSNGITDRMIGILSVMLFFLNGVCYTDVDYNVNKKKRIRMEKMHDRDAMYCGGRYLCHLWWDCICQWFRHRVFRYLAVVCGGFTVSGNHDSCRIMETCAAGNPADTARGSLYRIGHISIDRGTGDQSYGNDR